MMGEQTTVRIKQCILRQIVPTAELMCAPCYLWRPLYTHTRAHTQLGIAFRFFLNYFRVWVTWLLTQRSHVLSWFSLMDVVSKHPPAAEWSKKTPATCICCTVTFQISRHSVSTSTVTLNQNLFWCRVFRLMTLSIFLDFLIFSCVVLQLYLWGSSSLHVWWGTCFWLP